MLEGLHVVSAVYMKSMKWLQLNSAQFVQNDTIHRFAVLIDFIVWSGQRKCMNHLMRACIP